MWRSAMRRDRITQHDHRLAMDKELTLPAPKLGAARIIDGFAGDPRHDTLNQIDNRRRWT